MDKLVVSMILAASLAGCTANPNDRVVDQCLRAQLFKECLKTVPPGPQSTRYNDWDDVVDSCGNQAYYLSLRSANQVSNKCDSGGRHE